MKKGKNVKVLMDVIGVTLRRELGWAIDQNVTGTVAEVHGKRVGVQVGTKVLWFDAEAVKVIQ